MPLDRSIEDYDIVVKRVAAGGYVVVHARVGERNVKLAGCLGRVSQLAAGSGRRFTSSVTTSGEPGHDNHPSPYLRSIAMTRA